MLKFVNILVKIRPHPKGIIDIVVVQVTIRIDREYIRVVTIKVIRRADQNKTKGPKGRTTI